MTPGTSIRFFDEQFRRQIESGERQLNPFEQTALPFLRGHVLDYGCGLGNLSLAAAGQGCSALGLDASPAAIESLRTMALQHGLPIEADLADLRGHVLPIEAFDSVVAIGLLMFFDCADARRQLARLQAAVQNFDAPRGLRKRFATVIARKVPR